MTTTEGNITFGTGAVRGTDADTTRYDLITPIGLRRLAETYAEGARKYSPRNWEKGIPASNLLNHALKHQQQWLAGDRSEDHLAHAAWGLFALMHFEEVRPELVDIPARMEG
jgi:hypothetical protein